MARSSEQQRTLDAIPTGDLAPYVDHIMRPDARIDEPSLAPADGDEPTDDEQADDLARAHEAFGKRTHLFLQTGATIEAVPA